MTGDILCVGEVLWDIFPTGRFLGGAPLNVACHLQALGLPALMVSRVGNDELGREIFQRLPQSGLTTDFIQTDAQLPTGRVHVSFQCPQTPEYDIVMPASWDAIECTDELAERAARCRAIVFGSLAQRSERSRETIQRLLKTTALRVFDVNLRTPFSNREVVEQSLQQSDLVKLNEDELRRLCEWFDVKGTSAAQNAGAIAHRFGCASICITRGREGAAWWHHGSWHEHAGYRVAVVDTVGAGDAFLAALLSGLLLGHSPADVLPYANAVGAFVATQSGATPPLTRRAIEELTVQADAASSILAR
jgi:fructokinase